MEQENVSPAHNLHTVSTAVAKFAGSAVELNRSRVPKHLSLVVENLAQYLEFHSTNLAGVHMFDCPRGEFYDLLNEFVNDCSMIKAWNEPDEQGHFTDLTALVQNVTLELYGAVPNPVVATKDLDREDLAHIADANVAHYSLDNKRKFEAPVAMTPSAYLESCLQTESNDFFQPADIQELRFVMGNLVIVNGQLDGFKKAMFYGKAMPDTQIGLSLDNANDPAEIEIDPRLLHGVIGCVTEAGELLEQVYNHIFTGQPLDTRNIYEEVGDMMFYQSLILKYLGVTWEGAMHDNKQKRFKRYQGGKFSQEAAINRDVESELQEMTQSGNLQSPEQE